MRGKLDEVLRIREEQLPVLEQLEDVREKSVVQGKIASILQVRGQFDEAITLHSERLASGRSLGDPDLVAHALYSIAHVELQRGDHEREGAEVIRDRLSEAFAINTKLGRPDGIARTGALLAQLLAIEGRMDEALDVLDRAEAAFTKLEDAPGLTHVQALRNQIRDTPGSRKRVRQPPEATH